MQHHLGPVSKLPSDPALLRNIYGRFPSGVTAICAEVDGVAYGMAASSFTSVSIDPPLVSVCVQGGSSTWPRLRGASRIGVSVLAHGQEAACRSLADKNGDRFRGIDWHSTPDGAIFVEHAAAWLDCTLETEVHAGDHLIALLRVHGVGADHDAEPLVFHGSRFRKLAAL